MLDDLSPLVEAGYASGLKAGSTRLELAASCVTGRRSNQLNYDPRSFCKQILNLGSAEIRCKSGWKKLRANRKPNAARVCYLGVFFIMFIKFDANHIA